MTDEPKFSSFALAGKRIWVAGHRGMVGAALARRLAREDCEIITASRAALDLTRQDAVSRWLDGTRPDAVIVAAAKVGGISANDTLPVEFLRDNLLIEINVINAAFEAGVAKLLFLGSSCIYPKHAEQPIVEESLLTGPLEPTNQWYAIAKIAGLKLCQAFRRQHGADFIAAMPTNLYGPGDNFDLESSHVIPALIRKVDTAKRQGADEVVIWGSGRPRREFLHVDDCADALVHVLGCYSDSSPVNIGSGEDLSIRELVEIIAQVVGYDGKIACDETKPDGTPRKLLNVGRLTGLGWRPTIPLRDGLCQTYDWYLANVGPEPSEARGAGSPAGMPAD